MEGIKQRDHANNKQVRCIYIVVVYKRSIIKRLEFLRPLRPSSALKFFPKNLSIGRKKWALKK
jgi:hypothetical protein